MEKLTGRTAEQKQLTDILNSPQAELVAILGRRRVGKTFLIRSVYKDYMAFEFSGIHDAPLKEQLQNFSLALGQVAKSPPAAVPASWLMAFTYLQQYLSPRLKKQKQVIFFDEFPWIQTPRSGFLSAFSHFWNTWASRQKNLKVVICGSAASWMIKNVVNNKGGLHNRITQRIRLMPFMLGEVEDYLASRQVKLDRYQLLQLYMALGGIPQYLNSIKPGESATQIIDRLCFTKDGFLKSEFKNLYHSLFDNPDHHIAIIKALAKQGKGLSRREVIETCGLSSGGTATKILDELSESGFITPYIPMGKHTKDAIYRLTDEYSLFYLKYIDKSRASGAGTWYKIAETPSWRSWSGIAFESICLKHIYQIKKALGIGGVYRQESTWRYMSGNDQGCQIDLLIDRRDGCINICEMKFYTAPFSISIDYADALRKKMEIFKARTKTRKTLLLTMVTTTAITQNINYTGLVQNEITMDALFEK